MGEIEALFMALMAFGAVAVLLFWRKSDFTIRVRRGRAHFRGKLPASLRQAVQEFLADEIERHRSFKVHGVWDKKRLRLWFRGDLSLGDQQRLRNVLVNGQ